MQSRAQTVVTSQHRCAPCLVREHAGGRGAGLTSLRALAAARAGAGAHGQGSQDWP